MSLVAYGSSDESSDEEVNHEKNDIQNSAKSVEIVDSLSNVKSHFPKTHMSLPVPKNNKISIELEAKMSADSDKVTQSKFLGFEGLPKPQSLQFKYSDIPEEDDTPLLFKTKPLVVDKLMKKDRTPARISIPSLSEFKDVEEELEQSKNKPTGSKSGSGLFSILPPPKSEIVTKKNSFIPRVLTKFAINPESNKTVTKVPLESVKKPLTSTIREKEAKKILPVMDYDSNSEDDEDDNEEHHRDFFSLSKTPILPEIADSLSTNFFTIPKNQEPEKDSTMNDGKERMKDIVEDSKITETVVEMEIDQGQNSTLVSTVMNLPRDEILLKNKAEVGPKLPVPEQEFNVDSAGNVAFDEKAIEYLCGKRGVKRKNKMIEEANIIEINGEDIKPDEREWLVKALTEEPVQRPVSMQGAGPSSQSKKKHQITYLAHQAKAMEVELKNTWSQNRVARKQTQSKYGF